MEEKMEVDPVSPKFDTFYLLKSITENQQKHGLRHYDYKRYADYCNRRMRRLRKMLKFTNQHKCVPRRKAKFQPKKVTPEVVTNLKFVELLIYNVEYCWARGMDFKYASEDPKHDRQKFHSRTRLTKAMSLAQKLNVIAGAVPQINTWTNLEIQAYYAYISAACFLEKKQWDQALENYRRSKMIYDELNNVTSDANLKSFYESRDRELTGLIAVCEHEK